MTPSPFMPPLPSTPSKAAVRMVHTFDQGRGGGSFEFAALKSKDMHMNGAAV